MKRKWLLSSSWTSGTRFSTLSSCSVCDSHDAVRVYTATHMMQYVFTLRPTWCSTCLHCDSHDAVRVYTVTHKMQYVFTLWLTWCSSGDWVTSVVGTDESAVGTWAEVAPSHEGRSVGCRGGNEEGKRERKEQVLVEGENTSVNLTSVIDSVYLSKL